MLKQTFVAELVPAEGTAEEPSGNPTIVDFGELESNEHIDCFYCHADFQRRGIGWVLFEAIERYAQAEWNLSHLHVEANITALPFFQRMEFATLMEKTSPVEE